MPYLFIGNDYYRFNEERGRVDKGYPKPITPNWVNIPGNVGASFGAKGFTYFLKGSTYYKFDDNAVRRIAGPKSVGVDFFKCTGRERFNEGSGGTGNQSKAKLATILLPLVLTCFYLSL
ncbi:stromelysin-3-like [Amphiura filiformis]|uniref:stromelysin-3-like n=1 Tax=Amphiura filiformis TaxID=82378 RepID=UPI003B21DFCC